MSTLTALLGGAALLLAAGLGDGGQVLASRAVADALDEDAVVRLEPSGETVLRGLPGTHEVFRVGSLPGTGPR